MNPTEMLVPFAIDANGGVARTEDPARQAAQHLTSAIGTTPGERVMRERYGSLVQTFDFSLGDEPSLEEIKTAVREAANGLVTTADVVGLVVQPSNNDGQAELRVQYTVRANGQTAETAISLPRTAIREDGIVTNVEI